MKEVALLLLFGYGLSQGKDIFAVPGRINDKASIGTNLLIKEGAGIFTKTEDLF